MDAVLAQTFTPHEYIIVDGGSSDGSVDLARRHPSVTKVISEKDKGIADAFNKGISLASGDVIGIINADDWYAPDALMICAKAMQDMRVDVVHGALQYWNERGPLECFYPNHDALRKEMSINHPTVFIRKSAYEKYGKFDISYKYAMDYELLLRMKEQGAHFCQLDNVLANMFLGGISDRYWYAAFAECARAKREILHQPASSTFYLGYQIVRTATRKFLQTLGLHQLIKAWRSHCSVMRKIH